MKKIKKDSGIYRISYEDKKDLDKEGKPKIKFNYYYKKTNKPITIEDLERIKKLMIPPSYTDVWVSLNPDNKLQATGIDIGGKVQYRYHTDHIKNATEKKFIRLYDFIKSIPKLNETMEKHWELDDYEKYKTIVIMLDIIKELHIRVGKEVYARKNKSYGITSLKKKHVNIDGDTIKFRFKGKSNKQLSYTLHSGKIASYLKLLMDLEGEKLFQYKIDNNIYRVTDVDLNQYIQEYMGKGFTCKDFRTYAANYHFTKSLLNETKKRKPKTQKILKQNLKKAQEDTAHYLRHTKAISKKSYVMKLLNDLYLEDPEYFIKNKNKDPLDVLMSIIRQFKKKIQEHKKKSS